MLRVSGGFVVILPDRGAIIGIVSYSKSIVYSIEQKVTEGVILWQ